MRGRTQNHANVKNLVTAAKNVEPVPLEPHAVPASLRKRPPLRKPAHKERNPDGVEKPLQQPPFRSALVKSLADAVDVHAVESRAKAGEDGEHEGPRAVGAVFHALEAGMQDQECRGGDEDGDHAPVQAALEGEVVESHVDGADERAEDEDEDSGKVREQAGRRYEGRMAV